MNILDETLKYYTNQMLDGFKKSDFYKTIQVGATNSAKFVLDKKCWKNIISLYNISKALRRRKHKWLFRESMVGENRL